MKVTHPTRKEPGWNLNPGLSDPEVCMHVHCTTSLGAMQLMCYFAQRPGGLPMPISVLPVFVFPIFWVRSWQDMASGPYPACCLFLYGCELRMVFTILNGWKKANVCDSENDMQSSMLINKNLLESSHIHSFSYCLWLLWCYNGRAE